MNMGFALFQGYFFAKPSIVTAKSISPTLVVLIDLLSLLSKDAELSLIEQLFKRNPELNIKLIRFINSASFYTARKITSIRQSLALLGYRKLQKWVTLLLFAGTDEEMDSNPLLERAAIRGRIAELLSQHVSGEEALWDSAFMAGVLSLADVLFQMPMETALAELNLSADIKNALTARIGALGAIVSITEALETETPATAAGQLAEYGLTLDDLFSIEKTAIIEYENYAGSDSDIEQGEDDARRAHAASAASSR